MSRVTVILGMNLRYSQDIIRMIQSRRTRWARHVERMRRLGTRTGYWWESQRDRDRKKEQYIGGWTLLRWILEK
jgi:hypothetical protein